MVKLTQMQEQVVILREPAIQKGGFYACELEALRQSVSTMPDFIVRRILDNYQSPSPDSGKGEDGD
jgi:hypothetical protein